MSSRYCRGYRIVACHRLTSKRRTCFARWSLDCYGGPSWRRRKFVRDAHEDSGGCARFFCEMVSRFLWSRRAESGGSSRFPPASVRGCDAHRVVISLRRCFREWLHAWEAVVTECSHGLRLLSCARGQAHLCSYTRLFSLRCSPLSCVDREHRAARLPPSHGKDRNISRPPTAQA